MEISNDKISELLKNPEIIGMISSLASGFSQESSAKASDDIQSEETTEIISPTESVDISVEERLTSNTRGDRHIALLKAIKPYINDTKKSKVDSLVKAIGVAGILNNYAGGVFENLFGKQ